MNNIAIIPARSGSKGLKDKNIMELKGIPLLAYSIKAALDSGLFDSIMVSTDSKEYANIALRYGAEVPFFRSEKNSTDTAGSWDVVKEVLYNYKKKGKFFETICLLQPTSPLRTADDIKNGYRLLKEKASNAITAVCEMEHSPLWSTTLSESLSLMPFRKKSKTKGPRQSLETYYRINGALYIRKIEYRGDDIRIIDDEEFALIMDRKRSVDIDTIEDFEIAEFYINKFNL